LNALEEQRAEANLDSWTLEEVTRLRRNVFLTRGFMPLINPAEPEQLWKVWPEVQPAAIAISYLFLRRNSRLLLKAREEGIKKAIGFNGRVVSVLIGRNYELDQQGVGSYAADVNTMGFDAATTYDDYVYLTDSPFSQWSRIHTMLDRATALRTEAPKTELIGIVQGASAGQLKFCIDHMLRLGITKVALPCSDLVARRRPELITDFSRLATSASLWHWLIGVNSPAQLNRFHADVLSGYGWCYLGRQGLVYRKGRVVSARSNRFCRHDLCLRLALRGLSMPELCSRHNLLYSLEQASEVSHV
jgi:hypothetical protein